MSMAVRIVKLPCRSHFPVSITFSFSYQLFVAVSVITSFLTLPAFVLCFYSYSVFVFFFSRCITLDFGLGASSFETVVLWDVHCGWVVTDVVEEPSASIFKIDGPLLALPLHQTVRCCWCHCEDLKLHICPAFRRMMQTPSSGWAWSCSLFRYYFLGLTFVLLLFIFSLFLVILHFSPFCLFLLSLFFLLRSSSIALLPAFVSFYTSLSSIFAFPFLKTKLLR
jgi:hypothetical protein